MNISGKVKVIKGKGNRVVIIPLNIKGEYNGSDCADNIFELCPKGV